MRNCYLIDYVLSYFDFVKSINLEVVLFSCLGIFGV